MNTEEKNKLYHEIQDKLIISMDVVNLEKVVCNEIYDGINDWEQDKVRVDISDGRLARIKFIYVSLREQECIISKVNKSMYYMDEDKNITLFHTFLGKTVGHVKHSIDGSLSKLDRLFKNQAHNEMEDQLLNDVKESLTKLEIHWIGIKFPDELCLQYSKEFLIARNKYKNCLEEKEGFRFRDFEEKLNDIMISSEINAPAQIYLGYVTNLLAEELL